MGVGRKLNNSCLLPQIITHLPQNFYGALNFRWKKRGGKKAKKTQGCKCDCTKIPERMTYETKLPATRANYAAAFLLA